MDELILGIDLGVTSLGWAMADLENDCIESVGARIFEAPMEMVKFEAGVPGGSNAAKRRKSVHQGRQIARKQARHRDMYIALQDWKLLPFAGAKAERRHELLTKLDRILAKTWHQRIRQESPEIADPGQVICYYLRTRALTSRLELDELGRVLYHLGQRRGFKSNRREGRAGVAGADAKKEEEERSRIKSSIRTLQSELDASKRTLGQYLAFVNPHETAMRNRKRSDIAEIWTERTMFESEFERIWSAQQVYYPEVLTRDRKARLERLMFWQRKVSGGKPGKCELERKPAIDRAPRSSLLAQRFRLIQTLNNLKVRASLGSEYRKLKPEERDRLLAELTVGISKTKGKRPSDLFGLPFSAVKERLKVKGKLNLDDDDAGYLRGNRTNAVMSRAFGAERWDKIPDKEKFRIVRIWMTEASPAKLLEAAKTKWDLSDERATDLASLEPEDGYASLSHQAMKRLLPWMEEHYLTYSEAVLKVYGDVNSGGEPMDFLPPVECVLPQIPNPVVKRALTELRKVVNELIRKHSTPEEIFKPRQIRIELARDLKRNAEQRADLQESQKANRQRRENAKTLLTEAGVSINGDAIERALLYIRCRECIFCGDSLGEVSDIFSPSSGVQVAHILPRRVQDDSPSNKVLAHHKCNLRQGDRTPIQAFKDELDPKWDWEKMLDRVKATRDEALLDKFTMTADRIKEFSNRHLSDTRYITSLAVKYLEQLYGGRDIAVPSEDRNRRCVYASSGTLTAKYRKRWGLNGVPKDLYGDGKGKKVRTDHRHHAVDAIVIALTSEAMIQQAAEDSKRHDPASGYREPKYFRPPWPRTGDAEQSVHAFRSEIRDLIEGIKVSHRVDHKLNGKIHEETFYSPKVEGKDFVYSRVPVFELSMEEIEDPRNRIEPDVLKALRKHFARTGGDPTKKLKQFEKNVPFIERKNGHKRLIRKVRVAVPASSMHSLDRRDGAPSVKLKENHHFVVFSHMEDNGEEIWYTPGPVSRFEVMRRKDAAKRTGMKQPYPVVEESDGPGSEYQMFLMKGDAVVMRDPKTDIEEVYILSSMSDGDFVFLRHNASVPSPKDLDLKQAQVRKKMQDVGDRIRTTSVDRMRELGCRKIVLDPLGGGWEQP